MKTILKISALMFLFIAASNVCFALTMLAVVSKEQAREMGVTMRSHTNGAEGVQVWLEFKTQGKFKEFRGVKLQMTVGGKHLVSAPLQASHPTTNSVSFTFSAEPSYLATSEFQIIVDEPLDRTAYLFKVKDFIEPEKSR